MDKEYSHEKIETQAQQFWQNCTASENSSKTKFYCLSMLPYPSGQIHMGHARNYTIGDVITRYQQMLGKNVLQPFGWDAFGLPAENAALERNLAPATWTYQNIAQMRTIIKRLGYAIDWSRELTTCRPEYYQWEQWLFLKMFEQGLAYKKEAVVNWDPVDQTVLANEQVVNGRGWRSGALVEQRNISQWFLKITAYAEELLNDLEQLTGWPEQVRTMQRNWIGKSEGLEITFPVAELPALKIFTTRPDTIYGVTYLALAPKHPLALKVAAQNTKVAAFIAKCQNIKVAEAEIATLPKEGIFSGLEATHPVTGSKLPIWIANFVLMDYGTGAIMAVPAHDQRDYEFAKQYDLKIQPVIRPMDGTWDFTQAAFTAPGILVNSGEYNGLTSAQAFTAIATHLAVPRTINYRLRDWGISRQRYWGTPIPIIYCPKCGMLPAKELPVLLPENLQLTDPRSPLTELPSFVNTTCHQCGSPARRETDTFDTFMESSWYFARYCCPDYQEAILDERAKYWLPVDQYIGGIEHAVMHLLYARFIYKVLHKAALVPGIEPFTNLLTQGMVLKDGTKMSKSKGNIVAPEAMINKYGADTVRLFIIFAAPPEQSLEWSESGIEGAQRFLKKLWAFAYQNQELLRTKAPIPKELQEERHQIHLILQQANHDIEKLQLNTVVSAAMKLFNLLPQLTPTLLPEAFSILLRLLNPITPHLAHYLWQELQYGPNIMEAPWPEVDLTACKPSQLEYMIQVNGKLRGKITVPQHTTSEQLETLALNNDNVRRCIGQQTIKKVIFVPQKLINIVL